MRRILQSLMVLVVVVALLPAMASSQVATGTPPFGSFAGGPETINLADLNSHWGFGIVAKAGRGSPFHYAIGFDNSLWNTVFNGGQSAWAPVNNTFGWQWQTQALSGYVTYTATTCLYSNWVYHDAAGTAHAFSSLALNPSSCSGTHYGSVTADDGSGYQMAASTTSSPVATVYPPSGGSITPPLQNPTGGAQMIDDNGNFISTSDGLSFIDTTGANVLTINSSYSSYSYPAPGGSKSVSVGYTNYPVRTNFGCSGIAEYGPNTVSLPTSITYADGSSYQITYEDTPGFAGSKTGRMHSVTLPTGGSITYDYWGGSNGRGIFCDGTTAAITRTVNDGTNSFQQVFYVVQNGGTSVTHAITYPQNDETVINFSGSFETQRQIYQGPAPPATGGMLLRTVFNCYNNDPNCSTTSTVSSPITAKDVYTNVGGVTSRVYTAYNGYGQPTEIDNYDFTTANWNLLKKTIISYATNLGNIVDRPWSVTVKDGSNNILADTEYRYDEYGLGSTASNNPPVPQHGDPPQTQRGNVTTVSHLVQGTTYLTKHFSYYDTGTVSSAQDVNGQNTIYNYDPTWSCGYSYVTSVTAPINNMYTWTEWKCDGGVPFYSTDLNGQPTNVAYNDANFWRPTSVTDPLGNATNTNYASPTLSETGMWFNNNNSFTDSIPTLDGLGRPHVIQRRQGPGSLLNVFDSAETDYDSYGRPSRSTLGYVATSIGQTNSTAPATTTTYDALSRPTFVKTLDSQGTVLSTVQSVYVANDVWVQGQPAPAGENFKTRQYEYDGLGRLTSVCEITTSGSGWGPCGQTNPQNGYWTKYTYDVLGNLTGVTQNAQAAVGSQQTRIFSYDGLGRMTGQRDPETSNTVFAYDSDATCGTSNGDLVRKVDQAGNVTCYQYDAIHRVTMISYPSGPNAAVTPSKGFVYDVWGGTPTAANAKGRLAVAYTCNPSTCATSWLTSELFSYSARGEIVDFYESTPHSGSAYHLNQTYWNHGLPGTLSGVPGMPSITYGSFTGNGGLDGEGRITQVTAGTGINPVNSVSYNNTDPSSSPYQPLGALLAVSLGTSTSGQYDSDSFSYDKNTGRLTQYTFNVNGQTDTGTLAWNANGSLKQLAIVDAISGTIDGQTCNYTHDDLGRIASANCGAPWSQSFSYDPFGNINKSGSLTFQPGAYPVSTNQVPSSFGFTYDNNGNLTSDGLTSYTWDAEGKMLSAASPWLGTSASATYDALGRMVEQQRGTSYQQIVYGPDGGKLALMNGQTLTKAFVPLPGGATAVYTSSGLAYYRHSDWLGSSRLASTPSRTVSSSASYAPFGESYNGTGTADLSFTGQNQDTVPGLYDFMFREYTPNQGRWISPDPAGRAAVSMKNPQSWNRYAYVSNNPLVLVDLLGLDASLYFNGDGNQSGFGNFYSDWAAGLGGYSAASHDPMLATDGSGEGGGGGGDTEFTLGLRTPGQTFRQCMTVHAQDYSMVGAADLVLGTDLQSNFGFGLLGGNHIMGLYTAVFEGEGKEAATLATHAAPETVAWGMGNALSYGRRGAALMSLNLAGKGGVPTALTAVPEVTDMVKLGLEGLGKVLNLGMSLTTRIAVDVALTGAEAIGCSLPQ